jgi:pimeloyl-ACP methyl ester carboxylesterase
MTQVWAYRDSGAVWHAFNRADQAALDMALSGNTSIPVPVLEGRYEVHVLERTMHNVYDARSGHFEVALSTWFAGGVPYPEKDGDLISAWVKSPFARETPLTVGGKRIYQDSEGNNYQSPDNLLKAAIRVYQVVNGTVADPMVVIDPDSATTTPFTDLVLCVHGIGESIWSKQLFNLLPFESNCSTFRQFLGEFGTSHSKRVEVLPISWFHIFSESECAKRISDITLPTVPFLRQFANGAVSDVIFYLNERHRVKILQHVANRVADVVERFRSRNKSFSGRVTLIGHSLGSVICYDLLQSKLVEGLVDIHHLFLFGSPLSMFLAAREDSLLQHFGHCTSLYNIFQPHDPVAYRIEPFVDPVLKTVDPAWIPSHITGGMSAHTKIKQATASLWSMFSGDAQNVPLATKLQQMVSGTTSIPENSPEAVAISAIESQNGGARLDWSVQAGFTATEYANAISAHVSYFNDRDIAKFVFDKLIADQSTHPNSNP